MASTYPATSSLPQNASIQNRYLMDEASGDAIDEQTSTDLTNTNSVGAGTGMTQTNASYDNSRSFNGSSQHFLSSAAEHDLTGSFSYNVWGQS